MRDRHRSRRARTRAPPRAPTAAPPARRRPRRTTSTSCGFQTSSASALTTASLAQKRAARCIAGRGRLCGVRALGVSEQTLGEARPAGQRPLQPIDLEKVDADAAHPDGQLYPSSCPFRYLRLVLPPATVGCAGGQGSNTRTERERMAPKGYPQPPGTVAVRVTEAITTAMADLSQHHAAGVRSFAFAEARDAAFAAASRELRFCLDAEGRLTYVEGPWQSAARPRADRAARRALARRGQPARPRRDARGDRARAVGARAGRARPAHGRRHGQPTASCTGRCWRAPAPTSITAVGYERDHALAAAQAESARLPSAGPRRSSRRSTT